MLVIHVCIVHVGLPTIHVCIVHVGLPTFHVCIVHVGLTIIHVCIVHVGIPTIHVCNVHVGLPRIGMQSYITKFWRPNGTQRDPTRLATIEAIYYFVREYHTIYMAQSYDAQYDNLLMIFKFMYMKIRDFHHGGGKLRAYRK